jgi:hypothetical protein
MARLIEQLIKENKIDKAKKVLDLGMNKMPINSFGYYRFLEPFVSGYYDINDPKKAQEILTKLFAKYQDNLRYFATLDIENQNLVYAEIVTDIESYRSLLKLIKSKNDINFYTKNVSKFNEIARKFKRFEVDEE